MGTPFALFAPRAARVTLQGSWNAFTDHAMTRADDGVWRCEVDLKDGVYEYRFMVTRYAESEPGGDVAPIRVAVPDPLCLRITGTHLDVSEITLVNGEIQHTSYAWQHNDVPLVENDRLIVYELNIADFNTGGDSDPQSAPLGTFQRVIEKLDHLVALGVTAVEFMPFTQTAQGDVWGYSPLSPYAVDSAFGTPDDLAALIDACHARGLRVIQDAVYNHLHEDAPLHRIDPTYWFYAENPDEPDLHFGPKLNYEFFDESVGLYPAREYVLGAINRWVSHFNIDGVRFDCTRAIRLHDVLHWFDDEAQRRAGFKPFFTIAEHLPTDPGVTGRDGPLDAAWYEPYFAQMRTTLVGIAEHEREPFDTAAVLHVLDARHDGFDSNHNIVRYHNSHDHDSVMHLLGAKAGVFDDAAFRRCALGAILLFTTPGIPMITMGEEFGMGTPNPPHDGRAPIEWALLDNPRNQALMGLYQRLIAMRKVCDALTSEFIAPLAEFPDRGIVAYKRWSDKGDLVVIVANLRPTYGGEVQIALPGIADGLWHEVVFDYETRSSDGVLTDTLAESEAKVFVYQGAHPGKDDHAG